MEDLPPNIIAVWYIPPVSRIIRNRIWSILLDPKELGQLIHP
jgi:hypothetical protein